MIEDQKEQYEPTIGLEIHAELKTQTKMFCDCLNDPNEHHPNVNICSICAGHPGVLPTINKKAIEHVLKVGFALGGKIFPSGRAKFDRKNYFYPDLPKGYQISQYDEPLVEGGKLLGIRIRRVHLEEDAGRLSHGKEGSLVDFNRAGVPLMELVTEPDVKTVKQASDLAKELKLLIRYLNVSDADMEKGQLRLEANVSLSDSKGLGTKVEVKNINSFKALQDAINYEIKRQEKVLSSGKKVIHETRGWNEAKKATISQRSKEEAQDYRYFPEPDLPPLDKSAFNIQAIKVDIPELPGAKRKRFQEEYKLDERQVEILIQDIAIADYFEQAVSELDKPEEIPVLYNYFTTDLFGLMKKNELAIQDLKITPTNLAHLMDLIASKKITSRIAKNLLPKMLETELDPHEIMEKEEWEQVSDENALKPLAEKIIKKHPKPVEDYKKGKTQAVQFLVGMAMSELGGNADPNTLRQIFEDLLKS